ncbi:hypothetical protein [Massilia sp. DWR3-1-1]|uniref:hypothetical protein n=1 Tax=Massilia sp. DWR3-1-1 TaxID=2804559 RepID=UPI003CEB3A98
MNVSTSFSTAPILERIWFVNTDIHSSHEFACDPGDASPFTHRRRAGRMFVTPRPEKLEKYNKASLVIEPGDSVFACDDHAVLRTLLIDLALAFGPFVADQGAYLASRRRFVFGQPPRRLHNLVGDIAAAGSTVLPGFSHAPSAPEA